MDPTQPLVTVVIIFLNEERYLSQAIDSVRVQEYQHWELILVDDGSSDGSGAIARAAQAGAPERIRYVQHPGGQNRGMGNSRNLGLSHASGSYICFLDADDFFLPGKLRLQVELLRSHPDVAATCGRYLLLFSDEREYEVNHRLQDLLDLPGQTMKGSELIWRMNAEESLTPQHAVMLIRCEVARAIGGFTDQFQGIYEDSVFFTKLLAGNTVYISDDCVSVYRMHWNSFCHRAMESGDYPDTPLNALRYRYNIWLLQFLRARGIYGRLIALVCIEVISYRFKVLYPLLRRVHRRIASHHGHTSDAYRGKQQNELVASIAEVLRFYRSTERADEVKQLIQRMKRFMSTQEMASLEMAGPDA